MTKMEDAQMGTAILEDIQRSLNPAHKSKITDTGLAIKVGNDKLLTIEYCGTGLNEDAIFEYNVKVIATGGTLEHNSLNLYRLDKVAVTRFKYIANAKYPAEYKEVDEIIKTNPDLPVTGEVSDMYEIAPNIMAEIEELINFYK